MAGVSGSLYLLAYVGTQRDVGLVRIVQTLFSPAALVVAAAAEWVARSVMRLRCAVETMPLGEGPVVLRAPQVWLYPGAGQCPIGDAVSI